MLLLDRPKHPSAPPPQKTKRKKENGEEVKHFENILKHYNWMMLLTI